MSTHNVQPSMASASGRQAGLGLGAGAAGTVPPALLLLVPQIIAAGGDENIALLTIESAWDGTLNIITCGRIIPLADAIQRSTAILEEALPVFISRSSRIHQGQGWGSDVMMRYTARLAIGKLKQLDFEGLGFAHYQAIYLALVSHVDAWEHGPLHDDVNAILQFSGRMAKLLKPESSA